MTAGSVRRVRPWLRRAAIAACVVLVPAALWSLWDYIEARRLSRLVSEIQARGEPVTAWMRYPPEADTAAARYYGAAAALVDTTGLYEAEGLLARLDRGEPVTAVLPELKALLAANADAEAFLARATALPFEGERPGFDYNYRIDRLNRLGVLADLRALERASAGDGDGAAQAIVEQARLVRPLAWSAASGFSDRLTGFGTYRAARAAADVPLALESGTSDAALERLGRELDALDVDTAIEAGLLAERALQLQTYWDTGRDWYASAPRGYRAPGPALLLVARPLVVHRLHQQLKEMEALLSVARRPWPERLQVEAPGDEEIAAIRRGGLATLGRAYWIGTVRYQHRARAERAAGTLALVRAARTAVAVETFRRTHGGTLPGGLDALVPAALASVPVDPYSGGPLRYQTAGDGYAIYSVGENRTDDGGRELQASGGRRYTAYARRQQAADIGVAVGLEPAAR